MKKEKAEKEKKEANARALKKEKVEKEQLEQAAKKQQDATAEKQAAGKKQEANARALKKQKAEKEKKEQEAKKQGLATLPDNIASSGSINIIPDIDMLIAKLNQYEHGVDFGKIVTISYDDNNRKVYEIKYDKDGAKERLNESEIQIVLKLHTSIKSPAGRKVRRLKLSPIEKLVVVMVATAATTILPIKAAQIMLLIYLEAIARTMTITVLVPVLF